MAGRRAVQAALEGWEVGHNVLYTGSRREVGARGRTRISAAGVVFRFRRWGGPAVVPASGASRRPEVCREPGRRNDGKLSCTTGNADGIQGCVSF